MNGSIFFRFLLCVFILGTLLYSYINKQNFITELRLRIPALAKELEAIKQENICLQFEIDQFENPQHLMELAKKPEFSHLKYPLLNEIITIEVP